MSERAGVGGAVDVVLGSAAAASDAAGVVARPAIAAARPVARLLLRPPLVPRRARPATWLDAAARRGAAVRGAAAKQLTTRLDAALPVITTALDGHVDLTRIVQEHVDLLTVTRDLVTEIDLPEIIRGSTGAIASETVVGVRMHSMSADDALGRATDRVRARLTRRARTPPGVG